MKALKIENTADGLRLARCLSGSPIDNGENLVSAYDGYFCVTYKTGYVDEEYLVVPIDSIVFDPFAAMREGIKTLFVSPNGVQHCERLISCLANENEEVTFGGYTEQEGGVFRIFTMDMIHLDIEAACLIDGVDLVEVEG